MLQLICPSCVGGCVCLAVASCEAWTVIITLNGTHKRCSVKITLGIHYLCTICCCWDLLNVRMRVRRRQATPLYSVSVLIKAVRCRAAPQIRWQALISLPVVWNKPVKSRDLTKLELWLSRAVKWRRGRRVSMVTLYTIRHTDTDDWPLFIIP